MKKFTQLLSYSAKLFLCFILISLTGCEKEDLDSTTTNSTISEGLRLRNFSSDIIKLSDKNFDPILRSQIQNSISYNDREIDTSIARVIRIGNYEAYTFTTIKEEGYDETQLENIIFSSNDTESDYTTTFVSFDLTDGQYINLLNNKDLEYPLSLTNYETQNLVFDGDDCVDVTVTITHTNEDGEYSFVPGQSECQHPGECIVTTTIQVNYLAPSSCNDSGGGNIGNPADTNFPVDVSPGNFSGGIDDSSTTYNPSSPGGNNNGNYDGLTDENGFPVIRGSLTLFAPGEKFIANLPPELATIFDDLPEGLQEKIEDFIDNHPDDENAEAFAQEAIEASEDKDGDGEPDAEVDFEDRIFEVFEGTDTDCVHDKMKEIDENDPNITLYHKLLNRFNDATDNWLVFEVGSTTNGNWGETSGSWINSVNNNGSLPDIYKIIISNNIDQNGSNLAKEVTLIHELIHAYMFDTLSDAGFITFNSIGEPIVTQAQLNNLNCNLVDLPSPSSIFLNDYSQAERFAILFCAMYYTGTAQTTDWSHDLFGNISFSVNTYQQQMADYLYENHDWDSEPLAFQTLMENEFGNNWKQEVSEFASWRGLEKTQQFQDWYTNSGYATSTDSQGNTTYPTMSTTISGIKSLANSNCN